MARSFSDWYEKEGSKWNELRKNRYRADEEYRKAIVERQRDYRKRKSTVDRDVVKLEVDRKGVRHEVYRIGQVAEMLDRKPQTIRLWEKDGRIPKTTVRGLHRWYTKKQVSLLRGLMLALRWGSEDTISKETKRVHNEWWEV